MTTKSMSHLLIPFLIFTAGLCWAESSESPNLRFERLTADNGLKIGAVLDITQDHQGFMWFAGTTGLARYDGYDYKIYVHKKDQPASLSFGPVIRLLEDNDKNMWIATLSGLNRYERDLDSFRPIKLSPAQADNSIATVMKDRKGFLWLPAKSGLYRMDPKTEAQVVYQNEGFKDVVAMVESHNGNIWLASQSKGLIRWNPTTNEHKLYPYSATDSAGLVEGLVSDIYEDQQHQLWISSFSGLYLWNEQQDSFIRYKNDPADPSSLGASVVAKVLEDSRGDLWVATDGGGLNLFNRHTDKFTRYLPDSFNPSTLSSNVIRSVYEDPQGDLWVGLYPSGVNHHNQLKSVFETYQNNPLQPYSINSNDAGSVTEDDKGNLWLGTGDGLNYFDRSSKKFYHYKNQPKDPGTLGGAPVMKVMFDSKGTLWAATWAGGLHRLDAGAKAFHTYKPEPNNAASLSNINIWGMLEDRDGTLWFGSMDGLNRYVPERDGFVRYQNDPKNPSSIGTNYVWALAQDHDGYIWAGTTGGLERLDLKTGVFKHYVSDAANAKSLNNNNVVAVHIDKLNRVWLGTEGGGLNGLNPSDDSFTHFTTNEGLPSNNVTGILEDDEGNLWLSGPSGITRFDPKSKRMQQFSKDSGLQSNEFSYSTHKLRTGELVFGGRQGFNIFNPKNVKTNSVLPQVQMTNFTIATQPVVIGEEGSPLQKAINQTNNITLTADQSIFSFEYSALSYRSAAKNQYAYKLDGFDKSWHFIGDKRSATYTNLDQGQYTFRVKAANNDGIWSETENSVHLTVLPPWWKTWWAYTLYTLLIAGQIFRVIHSQVQKRKLAEEANRLLEIKVSERTAELREKNKDIQAMLGNMRQGLFSIESNGNIHPEYSHFLEDIFETKQVAGVDALQLLFGKSNLGSDYFDQIKQSMFSIIGEDEINYAFNSHLLIEDYEADFNGNKKYLSLDWNPITADGLVTKLMVSVRDVSLLKKMENEAQSKKRELDIISQLLNISAKKYAAFVASTQRFISENLAQIEATSTRNDAVIALLFRNMHTIKGNCRTFGFNYFSNVAHEVESVYSALKADPEAVWEPETLCRDLVKVESVLQEYEYVYRTVLGRGASSARDQNGFWADSKTIETIQNCIDKVNIKFPKLQEEKELQPIQQVLNIAQSTSLSEVLADIIASLPSIAVQLNKEAPKVGVEENHVRIKSNATELLTNIFAHILRNCVDHGIETPAVRTQAGKPGCGTINIQAVANQQTLQLHVVDDGQGINIDRLFKKGVEVGKWQTTDQPSYQEIADLIFASGVSTKEQVTDISGRGVGMDAVKQFLLAQGGNIRLHLLGDNANAQSIGKNIMVPFELIIELPENTFTTEV